MTGALKENLQAAGAASLPQIVAGQMEIGAEFSDGYVSLGTGAVCRLHEFDENSPERHLAQAGLLRMIPTITSQDPFLWMLDFTGEVEDALWRKELETSLGGISAVWKFRNVLYHNPALSGRWEGFKRERLLALAQDWLDSRL